MFQRGHFLVLGGDDGQAQSMIAPLQQYSITRRAHTVEAAHELLEQIDRWAGLLVDLDGLQPDPQRVLTFLRRARASLPMLAVVHAAGAALINAAQRLGVSLLCKPLDPEQLAFFARPSLAQHWLPDGRVAAWVEELARRKGLTAREVQLTTFALGNEPRALVLRRLGISDNTLKSQVRGLLRKCDARSMDDLARLVLQDALLPLAARERAAAVEAADLAEAAPAEAS